MRGVIIQSFYGPDVQFFFIMETSKNPVYSIGQVRSFRDSSVTCFIEYINEETFDQAYVDKYCDKILILFNEILHFFLDFDRLHYWPYFRHMLF